MSTVQIHTGADTRLQLKQAVLLYRSSEGAVYATTHPVEIEADSPQRKVIGAGIPMTKESLAEFASAVSTATAFAGFIPERLLYSSPNLIAWWVPESIRKCWFKAKNRFIGTTVADVAHPAMVFIATPGDWYVFALKESARPTPKTKLAHAPHFNVWDGGRVCSGNVQLPATIDAATIDAYERAFFQSNFTHPNRERATSYKGGMTMLWRSQIKSPSIERMRRALRTSSETLEQAITRISKRKN